MIRILVESDHFLKILAVMLDPETPDEHRRAIADFFAHDVPDFLSGCERFGAEIPGLYPAPVSFAEDQADFEAKLPDAEAVIVEASRSTGRGRAEPPRHRAEIRRHPLEHRFRSMPRTAHHRSFAAAPGEYPGRRTGPLR